MEENMDPNEIKKIVSNHKIDIKELKSALTDIQNECPHKETIIKNVSAGLVALRKVCKACEKEIGYPSPDELKDAGY